MTTKVQDQARELQAELQALAARAVNVVASELAKMSRGVEALNEFPPEILTPEIILAVGRCDRELRAACASLERFQKLCEAEIERRKKARS